MSALSSGSRGNRSAAAPSIPSIPDIREIERLRRFLTRIASSDEIVGVGAVEPVIADPVGIAARELRARMNMAQCGLNGDEYPG